MTMIVDNYREEILQDKIWFKCECGLQDHVVEFQIVDLDAGEENRHWKSIMLDVSPVLNFRRSFFTRIWIAIRYIFNRPPRYSWYFDSVYIPAGEDLDKLEQMIKRVRTVAKMRKKVAAMKKAGNIKV